MQTLLAFVRINTHFIASVYW